MSESGSRRVVLALDSAGLDCSVAVGVGETILAEKRSNAMHGQAEMLLPLIEACMRDAAQAPNAIGLVAATVGPGSFTGIRVGLAAARGVALATGAKVIGLTSFEAVAAEVARTGSSDRRALLIALESRRQDLYLQFFGPRGNALSKPAAVLPVGLAEAAQAAVYGEPLLIAGDAAARAAAALPGYPHAILESSASGAVLAFRAALRILHASETAGAARPFYLRPPDAALPGGTRKQSPAGK